MIHLFKKLTSAFCIPAIFIMSFAPLAEAKDTAGQCVNGLTQQQIDRLYKVGVQESRIAEMCQDATQVPASSTSLLLLTKSLLLRRLINVSQTSMRCG